MASSSFPVRTPILVVSPPRVCVFDIALLTTLGTAGEQHDQFVPVTPVIDSISRPKVDPVLHHTRANRLRVRKVAKCHSSQRDRNLSGRSRIEAIKPARKQAASRPIEIFDDTHFSIVPYV